MSTNKTENLGLHSWVREDPFRMQEFNDNFNLIDKAVGEKAEKNALDALIGRMGTLETGQLVYKHSSYTGKGTCGDMDKTRLTFDFKPLLLIVSTSSSSPTYGGYPWVRGTYYGKVNGSESVIMTWDEKAVSWYHGAYPERQLNTKALYHYFAIGIKE